MNSLQINNPTQTPSQMKNTFIIFLFFFFSFKFRLRHIILKGSHLRDVERE